MADSVYLKTSVGCLQVIPLSLQNPGDSSLSLPSPLCGVLVPGFKMAGPRDGLPRTVVNRPCVMGHGDRPPDWSVTWFGEAQN